MKLTKQGVRNLDDLPSPKRRKLAAPPSTVLCSHKETKEEFYSGMCWLRCKDCGKPVGEPW